MVIENAHREQLKGLYAITDENLLSEETFAHAVELALQGGSRIIQYRDKSNDQNKRLQQAKILQSLCSKYNALCIINDDIELARDVDAHGVHLGKDDIAITQARKILGENSIIGISCYNDINLAIEAEKNNADYIAFGTMFSSSTKPEARSASPELIATAKRQCSVPVCAIGGITENNIEQVVQQGADMVAVISSLFSSDAVKATASRLSKHFNP